MARYNKLYDGVVIIHIHFQGQPHLVGQVIVQAAE